MSDDSRPEETGGKTSRKLISDVSREKVRLFSKRMNDILRQVARSPMGTVGTVILVAFFLMGAFGQQLAPYDVWIGEYDNRFGALAVPTLLGPTHSVYVGQGDDVQVEGVFIEKPGWPGPDISKYGLLRVVTEPALPTTISVDGIWRNTGSLDDVKMTIGEKRISFSDIPGYLTPEPITAEVLNYGRVTEVVGTFVECGVLNVSTQPSLPGTILVDGLPSGEGSLSSWVAPGTYNISFGAVEGYDVPANQTVNVTSGESVEVDGMYTVNSSAPGPDPESYCTISIVTIPEVPSTIIVDGSRTAQTTLDSLRISPLNETSRHVIEFTDVPGYITPNAVVLRWPNSTTPFLLAGSEYTLEAEFEACGLLEAHTSPSIPSTIVVNGEVRNDGSLSVYVPEGTYHVTFRTIDDYAVPEPGYMLFTVKVLPLFVFWGASLIAVWCARKPTSSTTRRLAVMLAAASAIASSALLAGGLVTEAGFVDGAFPHWAYAIGLGVVVLSLLSIGLMQTVIDKDVRLSMVLSLLIPVPYVATLLADLGPFAFSDLRFLAYSVAGILVGICAFLLTRSLKRSVLAFSTMEGDGRTAAFTDAVRATKLTGVLTTAGLILSGMCIYLVQHWTTHWLGTNNFGADILSELFLGASTSIIVGVAAAVIASVLGAIVGLYSGYVGGWVDEVIMRLNDIVLSIPWLVLMIVVAAMIGKIDLTGLILIIGLTGWSATARMVRAQVLSIRERQFIERARAIGSADMGIIRRHVLPNTFPLVFANTILTVAISILSEATLSFLGMRPVGTVTWGTMLSFAQGQNAFSIGLAGWIMVPGMCIVLIVLGFSLLGYALDDIMNPKLRKR
ncbi:MAG: ABC transporter permease [Methanobacteriota archaeon]|nr:MAG: ABC transporter permease [Euryarchaeota archaeon]